MTEKHLEEPSADYDLAPAYNLPLKPRLLEEFDSRACVDQLVLPCGQSEAMADRPISFCDIHSLEIEVQEPGSEKLLFRTDEAAGSARHLRARELPGPRRAPKRIRSLLSEYDVVIEAVAQEAGRGLGSVKKQKATPAFDLAAQKKMQDQLPELKAAPSTVVVVNGKWKASCGKQEHDQAEMEWDCEQLKTLQPLGETRRQGKAFSQDIVCRSAFETVLDLPNFMRCIGDPSRIAVDYIITGTSCGYPPQGPNTTSLKALVRAYPSGTTGFKLAFGPFGWSLGWGLHDAEDRKANAENAHAQRVSQLEGIAQGEGAGAKLKGEKGESRGAKAFRKASNREANRQRDLARAELASTNPPSSNILNQEYWHGKEDADKFSFSVTVFDREYSKDEITEIGEVLERLNVIWKQADTITVAISQCFHFLTAYPPSLIRPSASLSWDVFKIEISAATKMASDEVASKGTDVLRGVRYRALERYVSLEIEVVFIEATGKIGITFGYSIFKIGRLTLEALVSMEGKVSTKYELKRRFGLEDESAASGSELSVQGDLKLSGGILGKASILWYDFAVVEVSANGGAMVLAKCDIANFFDADGWKAFLIGKPIVGGADVRLCFGFTRRYSYTLWEGGEKQFWGATHEEELLERRRKQF